MDHISAGIDALRLHDWDAAHRIAQEEDRRRGAWFHGFLHLIEGDEDNARYWYRRAERPFPGLDAAEAELAALATTA